MATRTTAGREEAPTPRREATPGAPAALQRLADGSLFVPKPVQRQLGIRTLPVRIGDLAATVELNGKVIPTRNPAAASRRRLPAA
jgi:hypothetical protein